MTFSLSDLPPIFYIEQRRTWRCVPARSARFSVGPRPRVSPRAPENERNGLATCPVTEMVMSTPGLSPSQIQIDRAAPSLTLPPAATPVSTLTKFSMFFKTLVTQENGRPTDATQKYPLCLPFSPFIKGGGRERRGVFFGSWPAADTYISREHGTGRFKSTGRFFCLRCMTMGRRGVWRSMVRTSHSHAGNKGNNEKNRNHVTFWRHFYVIGTPSAQKTVSDPRVTPDLERVWP